MTAECRSKLFDVVWLLGVGLAATAWCAAAWAEVGVTFDEPGYLNSGLIAWRTGSNKQLMTWGTMPFPVDVMTLPLYLMERWVGEPFQAYFQLEDLLPVARAATLPFFWLLIVYGLRWGRLIGGPAGSRPL